MLSFHFKFVQTDGRTDIDLSTWRCVSMRCAFTPNMSLVSKLVMEYWDNVKFSHEVCADRWDGQTTVKQHTHTPLRSLDTGA